MVILDEILTRRRVYVPHIRELTKILIFEILEISISTKIRPFF